MSAGAVELDLDLSLSSAIPAKLARITIELTAQSSTGDKALCAKINTSPENLIEDGDNLIAAPFKEGSEIEPAADGGSIKLAWSDCGDSSIHGHITSLSPTSVVLGTKTSLVGKGKLDEAIQAATYKVVAKERFIPVFSHSGDACKPETIKLPAGIGEIDMKGFKCPMSAGAVELDLDLSLSSAIPAKLARITIELTAQSSTGDKALCAKINTSPENLIEDGDNLIAAPCTGRSSGTYCVGPVIAPFFPLKHTILQCPSGKLQTCPSGTYCGKGTGLPAGKETCEPEQSAVI